MPQFLPGEGEHLIVFDADDTLWFTQPLYDSAKEEIEELVTSLGLSASLWEKTLTTRDAENLLNLGYSPERFPLSCVQAYLDISHDSEDSPTVRRIAQIAKHIFETGAPLMPEVIETLEILSQENRLVLLTKGDYAVQQARIDGSDLKAYFSDIKIVADKTVESFADILKSDGRPANLAWSIGNSLPSDINPALRLGMNAFWIPASATWHHELRETEIEPGVCHQISHLYEVVTNLGIREPLASDSLGSL